MSPEEYNRQRCIEQAVLWRTVYAQHLKVGKKNATAIACVHADAALKEFNQRFKVDLNVTRPAYPPAIEAPRQA